MKRKIIQIDEDKCTGCGLCIPNCPEGAIQIIDRKARLVNDLFCDGLGACLGHCPEGAITIDEREAEPYSERQVMANIVRQGPNVIKAHLQHLRDHGESAYLAEALAVLKEKNLPDPFAEAQAPSSHAAGHAAYPGARTVEFGTSAGGRAGEAPGPQPSRLTHWPVQLHLISPAAPQYRGKDVLLAADCVAYAIGDFHQTHLKGKALAIACPKLDEGQEVYIEKIRSLIDDARINTLTVMIMQVPCCRGLLALTQKAAGQAARKVPIKCVVVGVQGDIVQEEWV